MTEMIDVPLIPGDKYDVSTDRTAFEKIGHDWTDLVYAGLDAHGPYMTFVRDDGEEEEILYYIITRIVHKGSGKEWRTSG